MSNQDNFAPLYLHQLQIKGVNSFVSQQTLNLTNSDGSTAMFTVILGNNNTGKTTLLRCLAGTAFAKKENHQGEIYFRNEMVDYSSEDFFKFNVEMKLRFINFTKHKLLTNSKSEHSNFIQFNLKNEYDFLFSTDGGSSYFHVLSNNYESFTKLAKNFIIDGYGTQRKQGKGSYVEYELKDRTETLFKDETDSIINAEEWFLGTDYDALKGNKQAKRNLNQIKDALISLLPDIEDILVGEEKRRVYFVNQSGDKMLVNQLGSGYQSLVTWVVDYAKRLFDRYPDSDNPLAEPGIVLVDEIDLHLHPDWQRKIVSFLRGKFPKTQFIVTAHSPLVVQSAENINVAILNYDEDKKEVAINQPPITNYQGWTVEEILSELMGMGDKVMSDKYLELITQFDKGLDNANFELAKEAYEELEKIVKSSGQLKLLRLQMAALTPLQHD